MYPYLIRSALLTAMTVAAVATAIPAAAMAATTSLPNVSCGPPGP
ncbi:hypothetical protein [Streptomyces lavendulae]